jgi:hypothetical protein
LKVPLISEPSGNVAVPVCTASRYVVSVHVAPLVVTVATWWCHSPSDGWPNVPCPMTPPAPLNTRKACSPVAYRSPTHSHWATFSLPTIRSANPASAGTSNRAHHSTVNSPLTAIE